MEHIQSVFTPLGIVYGRDGIYVDQINYRLDDRTLTIKGELNGALCSEYEGDEFVPYTLHCKQVYAFQTIELDVSESEITEPFLNLMSTNHTPSNYQSNWLQIYSSSLIEQVKKVRQIDIHHLLLYTYDDVITIGCTHYEMSINEEGVV